MRTGATGPPGSGAEAGTEATVAAADIARLAGLGKAAVSNWRRRFDDFPAPVAGTAASPRFSLAEVEEWMARHGKEFRVDADERVWQRLQSSVDDLRLGDLVGTVGAALVVAGRHPRRWATLARARDTGVAGRLTAELVRSAPEVPAIPEIDAQWVEPIRATVDAAARRDRAGVFGLLYDRYAEAHSRRLPATPEPLARLMADLAGVAGRHALDPACGTGALLLAAGAAGAARVSGQDLDTTAARIAAARLLLSDPPARVVTGDSLRADALAGERAGAVLCWPPFGDRAWGYDELVSDPRWQYGLPPRGEPELAWVQHCLAHAEPGSWVVVAMPGAAASRRPGRRIRGNLLRAGALRAVIGLPGGTPAAPDVDLWVLRRPRHEERPPSHLLVVDPAAGGEPGTGDDPGGYADRVRRVWSAYLADPDAQPPAPGRCVRIIDVLDDEVDLHPGRHLTPAASGDHGAAAASAADYPAVRAALAGAVAALPHLAPDLSVPASPRDLPSSTVGDLVRAGAIALDQAPLRTDTGAGDLPVLTVRDLRAGRGPTGRTVDAPGLVVLAPGDVVVPAATIGRETVARVVGDTAGTGAGAVLGPQAYRLRPDPDRIDPEFLAGLLRVAGGTGAGTRTSRAARTAAGSSRLDARRATVPLLPIDEQRRYGEAFRRLAALHDALHEATTLADTLVRLAHSALSTGTLVPPETGRP